MSKNGQPTVKRCFDTMIYIAMRLQFYIDKIKVGTLLDTNGLRIMWRFIDHLNEIVFLA